MQGSVVVPLPLERAQAEAPLLDYAYRTSRGAVYLACSGPAASGPPTCATLDLLTHCLEPSAHGMPRVDVFPLLPALGWDAERIASLADAEEVVAAAEEPAEASALLDALNAARARAGLPSLSLTLTSLRGEGGVAPAPAGPDGPAEQQQQQRGQQHGQQAQQQQQSGEQPAGASMDHEAAAAPAGPRSRVIGDWSGPLQFKKVAVGGTFDRLHAGHRLLLAATALVSTRDIYVGITSDALLANKKNRALLEPYEERAEAACGYMRLLNPAARVRAGPLTDPQVPPPCALEADYDAIVVSEETIPGANAINQTRAQLGFPPLVVVVVGLIYSRRRNAKLSSTDLREADAAAAGGGGASPRGGGSPQER